MEPKDLLSNKTGPDYSSTDILLFPGSLSGLDPTGEQLKANGLLSVISLNTIMPTQGGDGKICWTQEKHEEHCGNLRYQPCSEYIVLLRQC
jgi:hypothetical protein